MNYYNIVAFVYVGILILGILLYSYKIHFWKYAPRKQKLMPKAPQDKKYAVLIPAKFESRVIEQLLDSIKAQTYDLSLLDTYVIITQESDPTFEICKKYDNVNCYVLKNKVNTKGETLKEMFNVLYSSGKRYAGYFILDADNVIHPDFVEYMHDAMQAGNDVVLGSRLNKNPSAGLVNCGSTLTWTYLNTLNNKCRSENNQNILVQGSPLLISKTLIEDAWHGDWPFVGLTEDLELSYYCSINGYKTYYYEYAKAYDEQPTNYKQSVKQRLRWIKGHNAADKQYYKKFRSTKCKNLSGIYKFDTMYSLVAPIIVVASTLVFSLFSCVSFTLSFLAHNPAWVDSLIGFVLCFVGTYLILCAWTAFGLIMDRKNIGLTFWQNVKATFVVPFFFIGYIPIYIKALFVKDVKWEKIEHTQHKK